MKNSLLSTRFGLSKSLRLLANSYGYTPFISNSLNRFEASLRGTRFIVTLSISDIRDDCDMNLNWEVDLMFSNNDSRLPDKKFIESNKVIRLLSFNEINFSPLLGITDTFSISDRYVFVRKGRIKWQSYPEKLWNNTERKGFSRRLFRLQELCAGPRYFPVKWSWSRTCTKDDN